MFVTGDYVTLHVNGVRYLEKAPLPYWLVAESYRLFGVNEFATRLPMALSVMLLGLLAFVWGRRAFGERAGIYAGLFVYTAAGVFLFTRILIPDVLLSLLIAASLYFFLTALEDAGRGVVCGIRLHRAGRIDQRPDRTRVSGGRRFFLSADHWRVAALERVSPGFRLSLCSW